MTILFGMLASTVRMKISEDNYDNLEEVFNLMEEYAASENEILSASAVTGFMECMFNYSETYDPKYLACMLGPVSREFLRGWEGFHGNDPSWLDVKTVDEI